MASLPTLSTEIPVSPKAPEASSPLPPRVWTQLDSQRQQQLAQLWAALIQRQLQARINPPEASHEQA